jgi:hypothetical protein
VALYDAGALADPLVAGLEPRRELCVADDARRTSSGAGGTCALGLGNDVMIVPWPFILVKESFMVPRGCRAGSRKSAAPGAAEAGILGQTP